jgi:hypothetical protein
MPEELGKIEKPPVDNFKKGRKLFFVPLVFANTELPEDYLEIFNRYWEQVEKQVNELTSKLGNVNRVFYEMIAESGEAGTKAINELNEKSSGIVRLCLENKAQLEAIEDSSLLIEFMDWNRCLLIGLQHPNVISKVYDAYIETGKKRNEILACKLDEILKTDEIGLLFMRENHQVHFPTDIQVFYIAPPALDEIKRWLRERDQKSAGDNKPG